MVKRLQRSTKRKSQSFAMRQRRLAKKLTVEQLESDVVGEEQLESDVVGEEQLKADVLVEEQLESDVVGEDHFESHVGEEQHLLSENVVEDVDEGNTYEKKYSSIGDRIVDVGHLIWSIMKLMKSSDNGHTNTCTTKDWLVEKFIQRGIKTYIHLECKECKMWTIITSHPSDANPNYLFTAGTMSAGVPFANIEEIFSACGMPCMDAKTFRFYQGKVTQDMLQVASECVKENAEKEKEIAIAKGRVINGVPYISVICDGSYSKRSMGGRYDSPGNCNCVIGYETGEIIDFSIKNKNCANCDKAEKENRIPKEHLCFKNYEKSASSGGMEHVGIAKVFRRSYQKYGLIYKNLIGDGDSNVIYKIHKEDPYAEFNVKVKKIQCLNHLLKGVLKKNKKVSTIVGGAKFRRGPYRKARSILKSILFDIANEVRAAGKRRREDKNLTKAEKIKLLMKDVLNVLSHLLGEHKSCEELRWPCESRKVKKDENYVPLLKDTGIYAKSMKIFRDLSVHAESILFNATTNKCEWFNNLICKTIAGKRTDYTKGSRYAGACATAVVKCIKKKPLCTLFKRMKRKCPKVLQKLEDSRQIKIEKNRTNNTTPRRLPKFNQATDKNYGPKAQQPDKTEDELKFLCEQLENSQKENQVNRSEIFTKTLEQSESPLWMTLRREMLTASNYGRVCSQRDTTSAVKLVHDILYWEPKKSCILEALDYGKDHEKLAINDLSDLLSVQIKPSGLIIDSEFPFLGATPDGIIDTELKTLNIPSAKIMNVEVSSEMKDSIIGGTVEVKCPITAENAETLEQLLKVPSVKNMLDKKNSNALNKTHRYYYQVQGALRHSKRNFCIFGIWSKNVMHYMVIMRDDEFWKNKMEIKLTRFYKECLVFEIVDSRKDMNRPIREAKYYVKAKEEKKEQNPEEKDGEINLQISKSDKLKAGEESDEEDNNEFSSKEDSNDSSDSDSSDNEEFDAMFTAMMEDLNMTDEKEENTSFESEIEETQSVAKTFSDKDIEIEQEVKKCKISYENENDDVLITGVVIPNVRFLRDTLHIFPLENEKNTILSVKNMLNEICMDKMINLMQQKNNFTILSVQYIMYLDLIPPFEGNPPYNKDIQIIGGIEESRHWRCLYFDGEKLYIHDSLGAKTLTDLVDKERQYIKRRYPNLLDENVVPTVVTPQKDGTSCGVYALAYAIERWLGKDPSKRKFTRNGKIMRQHFYNILKSEVISSFPTQSKKFNDDV